jgi:DNA-binding PadR family transcriptional regulator
MVKETTEEAEPLKSLTGFQRDALAAIAAEDGQSGQEVKKRLERHYDEVNHGRLYPNIDALVREGMVRKGSIDRRTNSHTATAEGRSALRRNAEYQLGSL